MNPRNVVICGDAREVLADFASGSVDSIIESAPYFRRVAEERAAEANGEAEGLKASAAERKQAIQARLKALQ